MKLLQVSIQVQSQLVPGAYGHSFVHCSNYCRPCFVTIIGIPFGIHHLKLAGLAFAPVGKAIVSKEAAEAARLYAALASVARAGVKQQVAWTSL